MRRDTIYQERMLVFTPDCEVKSPLASASPLDRNSSPNSCGRNHFFQSAPNSFYQGTFCRDCHFRDRVVGGKSGRIRDRQYRRMKPFFGHGLANQTALNILELEPLCLPIKRPRYPMMVTTVEP
jgi:hypothetical protein